MKKLLTLFLTFFCISAHADMLSSCLENVAKTSEWKEGIASIFSNQELSEDTVTANRQQIYVLLSGLIPQHCNASIAAIAKTPAQRGKIYFTFSGKEYGFDFSLDEMFDGFAVQTGILVINKRNLSLNSILKLSDIPKKQKFFSDECSDWTIADNLDDDAAVNIAGQAVFNEFGGSKNEFFLDFAEGDNRRAFPGLVLMDETGSTTEKIVTYLNLRTGIEKAKEFASKLKSTQCSNQGLSVYLVALNVAKDSTHASIGLTSTAGAVTAGAAGWGAATGIKAAIVAESAKKLAAAEAAKLAAAEAAKTAGTFTVTTTAGEAAIGGAAAGGATAGGATAGGIFAAGGTFLGIPVAGWIIGGALLVTAGVIYGVSMIPQEILDIQQVAILDGPYNI